MRIIEDFMVLFNTSYILEKPFLTILTKLTCDMTLIITLLFIFFKGKYVFRPCTFSWFWKSSLLEIWLHFGPCVFKTSGFCPYFWTTLKTCLRGKQRSTSIVDLLTLVLTQTHVLGINFYLFMF